METTLIDIHHVTAEQHQMLEQIWACDTEDDVLELRCALDQDQCKMLDVLLEAIALGFLDAKIQTEVDCEEIRNILSVF